MNIKKIEKLCKDWKSFALIDQMEGDQTIQWIECGRGTYSLAGMPYMTPSQLLNVFGVRGGQQKQYLVATGEKSLEKSGVADSWPNEHRCEADPMWLTLRERRIEMVFFTSDLGVMAFEPEYIAPFDLEKCTFEIRWSGDACWMLVREGFFNAAAIHPVQINRESTMPERLRALANGLRRVSVWREEEAERQREIDWAASHPGEQIELLTGGEENAECT